MRILSLLIFFFILGCSSASKYDTSTAQGAFQYAEELEKDERYDEALQHFTDVKNKHPYSQYATQAELRVADIHYKREAFVEAQNSYQLFKEFHPKHPRSAYVTFRLAMSCFNQLPSTTDRDLSISDKAILYFDEVINSYSTSEFVSDSQTKKSETLKMLADKELYIAEFYFIRDMYDSALNRYERYLKNYPGLGNDKVALYGAAYSAVKSGQRERGQPFYQKLLNDFPKSSEAAKAKSELTEYGGT